MLDTVVTSYNCIKFPGNLMNSKWKTLVENLIVGLIRPKIESIFFSKIWLCQSLDIIVSYHNIQNQKKTNDPILRKLANVANGRTDGRTRVISKMLSHWRWASKIFLLLYSINWSYFIISLPLQLEMLGNMCIVIVCFQGCNVIKFGINLGFFIKPFSYMTKQVRTKN